MAVAAVLIVVTGACGDQSNGFDGAVADELDAMVERQATLGAAGGVVVRVVTPDGHRTIAAGPAGVDGELTGAEAFRIASITKMFTAVIAMQLVEEGTVELDAPIADVVPEQAALLEHGSEITLRQLLGHTSGLPMDPDPEVVDDPWKLHVEVADGVATVACDDVEPYIRLSRGVDAVFEPGAEFGYSNLGYRLLGEVIETVTGEPLASVYRERILDRLGMDNTWLDCVEEPRGDLARGLHPPGLDNPDVLSFPLPEQGEEPFDVTDLGRHAWSAGGLVSTAEDLAQFGRALFAGELFDDEATLATMLEPGPLPYYGLGVELGSGADEGTIGHSGAVPGYNSRLSYDLEREIVIVALSNETPNRHRTPLATTVAHAVRSVLVHPDQGALSLPRA